MSHRRSEEGVALINVLVVLALASTVVYAMMNVADIAIRRSQKYSEAGQALALIRGGEITAITALRRDMVDHPETDNATEAWSKVTQDSVAIDGGYFSLTIEDAEGLFNLNSLAGGGLAARVVLANILRALKLPDDVGERIAARLLRLGPLRSMTDLVFGAGISPQDVAKLATMTTVLPGRTAININSAPLGLMEALAQNPVQAQFLFKTRERDGFLTAKDVTAARVSLPAGVGFRSDFFRVTVTVTIGDTVQAMTSLLQRRQSLNRQPEVVVIARQNTLAAMLPPPPN